MVHEIFRKQVNDQIEVGRVQRFFDEARLVALLLSLISHPAYAYCRLAQSNDLTGVA